MHKPIKWSSYAENDLAILLEYLSEKWSSRVCLDFLTKMEYCLSMIEKNPNQFPLIHANNQIRKCVVTKQMLYFTEKMILKSTF